MMRADTATPPAAPAAAVTGGGYLPEVQGLRTVALVLVVIFHVWLGGRVSGGVDVFLLVSAFLMTRSLADAAVAGRRTQPIRFILRKFTRLVPAAAIAIVLTLVGVWLFLPMRTWSGSGADALASITYTMNWHLQSVSADYFNLDRTASSPFQQFWSLAIQGQVFVLWPILHLASELVARLTRIPVRRLLFGVFAAVFIGSFAVAVNAVATDPGAAYFDSVARMWEFAAGSLLALVQHRVRLPGPVRGLLLSLGLLGVVFGGIVLPTTAAFPGPAALVPVLSAAAVILGAGGDEPRGLGGVLASPLLRGIGGYTYALYLVHWPVLIIMIDATHTTRAGIRTGTAVVVISAVLAFLVTRLVERPVAAWVRRGAGFAGRPSMLVGPRSLATLLVCLAVVVACVLGGDARVRTAEAAAAAAIADADYGTLGPQATVPDASPRLPDDLLVPHIWTDSGSPCAADDPYATDFCMETGASDAEREVLVLGNSHSLAFNGMLLETIDREPTWKLRTQVSPGCTAHWPSTGDSDCDRLWRLGTAFIQDDRPDLVVIVGTLSNPGDVDSIVSEVPEWLDVVSNDTTQVVVLRDNPRFDFVPYDCAERLGYDDPECSGSTVLHDDAIEAFADQIAERRDVFVDLNDVICPGGRCRPSMGGLVTFADSNHLTEPFSRSLAQEFTERVRDHVDWWPHDTFPPRG